MKWIPLLMVTLLPSVLFAGVVVTSAPATPENLVVVARASMEEGDYVTAWALYECALRRDPHSPEALAGRLAARAELEERGEEDLIAALYRQ